MSQDDVLRDLLVVAKNIQDILTRAQGIPHNDKSIETRGALLEGTEAQTPPEPKAEYVYDLTNEESVETWLNPERTESYEGSREKYKSACNEMQQQLDELNVRLGVMDYETDFGITSSMLQLKLLGPVQTLDEYLKAPQDESTEKVKDAILLLCFTVCSIYDILSSRFYWFSFPNTKEWKDCLKNGFCKVSALLDERNYGGNLDYVASNFFPDLVAVMGTVSKELKSFSEEITKPEEEDLLERSEEYRSHLSQPITLTPWPKQGRIKVFKKRRTEYETACYEMQENLDHLITHYETVGGDKGVIGASKLLRRQLLGPARSLEKVLKATQNGGREAMGRATDSFWELYCDVSYFYESLYHQRHRLYFSKVKRWKALLRTGCSRINDNLKKNGYGPCLKYIHDDLLAELKAAMSDVSEELTAFVDESADVWPTKKEIEDFKSFCNDNTSPPVFLAGAWPKPMATEQYKERCSKHANLQMQEELGHLIAHYVRVGGDKKVIKASKLLRRKLIDPIQHMERALTKRSYDGEMDNVVISFRELYFAVNSFQESLYYQKHAFYFRKVKLWAECLWNGLHEINGLIISNELAECLEYIYSDFFTDLEAAMIGVANVAEGLQMFFEKSAMPGVVNVPEELTTFGKESLPAFLAEEKERDTTRYVNITTIATFFSSVTATTLQFTYAPSDPEPSSPLRGVVNLFWFLSLVFSVSSGVGSMLGMTWRKSSVYHSSVPPKVILVWLEKAPMIFLIIAAVAFIIGLNLFAYLSLQPQYVSLATNIFTGLHGVCLLAVTAWFIYEIKQESSWANWIRHPHRQYQKIKLHLKRNIYWAFGFDKRVARLSYEISGDDWSYDWPDPYLVSKIIRHVAFPVKMCCTGARIRLSALFQHVVEYIFSYRRCHHEDSRADVRDSGSQDELESSLDARPRSQVDEAKAQFCESLQRTFGDADRVEEIMSDIRRWENGSEDLAEQYLERELWGYPNLLKKFRTELRPILVRVRENKGNEREFEEQDLGPEKSNRFFRSNWMGELWKSYRLPEKKLHLQRNIFWALGNASRVARINQQISCEYDSPGPHPLFKLVRHLSYPFRMCWSSVRQLLSGLARPALDFVGSNLRRRHVQEEIQIEEGKAQETTEHSPSPTTMIGQHEKDLFRKSLQEIFGDSSLVNVVIDRINLWEHGRDAENDDEWLRRSLQQLLWGYPELISMFEDELEPVLAPIQAQNEDTYVLSQQEGTRASEQQQLDSPVSEHIFAEFERVSDIHGQPETLKAGPSSMHSSQENREATASCDPISTPDPQQMSTSPSADDAQSGTEAKETSLGYQDDIPGATVE